MQKIKNIRSPFASGKFYPAEKDKLEKEVKFYLAEAKNVNLEKEKIFALMSPHAGYQYAGEVLGSAYKAVMGRKINTVIIIANSHKKYFDGISIYNKGAYEIPLGNILIDEEMTDAIMEKNEKIIFDEDAHLGEHAIEVQLPFLKLALGDFKIVPIVMGNDLMSYCNILASAIGDVIRERNDVLIVASSDMSHYPPYDIANMIDKEVLDMIKKGEANELQSLLMELELRRLPNAITFLCGAGAVKTVMILAKAKGAVRIEVLKYLNSGDNIGGKEQVVGYGAVSFSYC